MNRLKTERKVPLHSEVKWNKAKSKPLLCRDYINLLFDLIEANHAHFHVRFSPFQEYDHAASGDRKETDTISKAYYQLLLHRAGRFYGKDCKVLVRPDDGDCTSYLPSIHGGLNADIGLTYKVGHEAITDIAPRNSKLDPMLQLLDVSLGALTAARSGGHKNGNLSVLKSELVRYALERSKWPDIEKSHAGKTRRFNIWNVEPKFKKGAVPTR